MFNSDSIICTMSCAHPWFSDDIVDFNGNRIPIPCGHCFSCRLDIQKSIVDRLFCASTLYSCSAFVTFTYDDEHLRFRDGFKQPTLSKDDLHKYFDKIRHQLPNIPFSYYACGEYGDKFNRPHYHALFFGLDYQLHQKFFENSWKLGSVCVLPCNQSSFRYVAKYVTAQYGKFDSEYFDFGLEPPFRKYSRALGVPVYLAHLDELSKNGFFMLRGKKISVNRYYFNKLLRYSDRLILAREKSLNDNSRLLSNEAKYFNLPVDVYKNLCLQSKEDSLVSKNINNNSNLY